MTHPVYTLAIALLALTTTAPSRAPRRTSEHRLSAHTVWRPGMQIVLDGDVRLSAGRTLVIEAGTRVEARPGARLVIERGSTLQANGTVLQPIVLTCVGSRTDPLQSPGCWGGVVLQGFAPINAGSLTSPPATRTGVGGCAELLNTSTGTSAGGCDADDSSGVLRYVRVELADEGLRLEGVGRRTVLEYLQVRRSRGNGVHVVGGTADLRRVVTSFNSDAGLAWTRGWRGRIQDLVVLTHPLEYREAIRGENGPTAAEASLVPRADPLLANVTVVAPSSPSNPHHTSSAAIRLVRGTALRLRNALVMVPHVALDIDDAATCAALSADALRSVVTAGATSAGDPDTDDAGCAAESVRLTDASHANQVLASATGMLVAPTSTSLPDLRPGQSPAWSGVTATALAPDGFLQVNSPFVGAFRAGTRGDVPWYAGWSVFQPISGVPIATSAASPSTFTDTAGRDVAQPPVVRVTDANGLGVADLGVTFTVATGAGSLAVTNTRTDIEGYARAERWSLGATVGPQLVTAAFDGLPNVVFQAAAIAPAGQGWLEVVSSTNGQVAPAGGVVPNAPAVLVRGASGAVASGVPVTFSVTSGGGAVTGSPAVSAANGIATVGSWRLGAQEGPQRLTVTAPGALGATIIAQANASGVPTLVRETLIPDGAVQWPWDLAFAPDSTLLFTQRFGLLQALRPGATTPVTLLQLTDLGVESQSGLLGLAVDPQFATNRFLYTYQSWLGGGGVRDNRVVRWRVAADWRSLGERTDIVTGISYNGGGHSGGRIRFGADGYLWIGTGDTRIGGVPQDLTVLGGKVLRVTRDGFAAPDNPSLGAGTDPRIFAFGFRNVQGLALREDGSMYSCEHGPVHQDEVTRLVAGGNGGWHPLFPGDGYGAYRGYEGQWPMTDTLRYPAALRPTWSTGAVSEGMAGCVFLRGAQWGAWDGALVVGLMSGFRALVLQVSADGQLVTATWPLWPNTERYRGFALGPDGALYGVSDYNGVWRIRVP